MKKILLVFISIIMILSFSMFFACSNNEDNTGSEIEKEEVVACEHEYEIIKTKEATCNTPKEVTYKCKKCGKTYSQVEGTKLGHAGEWIIEKEPTCYEEGREYRICTRCGHTDIKIIPSLKHNYVEDKEKEVLPDCTHNGKKVYKCTNEGCDKSYEEIIFALGHTPDGEGVVVKPTCTEEGYTKYHCSVCGQDYKDNFVKSLGHDFVYDSDVEATCEHPQGKKFVCIHEGCDCVRYEYSGNPLIHKFGEDGKCVTCGKTIDCLNPFTVSSDDFYYERVKNSDYEYIYNYKKGVMNNVPMFNFILSSDMVNQYIENGFESMIVKISPKTDKMATKFIDGKSINTIGFNKKIVFEKNKDFSIKDLNIQNNCDSEWFYKGYVDCDGFKISLSYIKKFNKDDPESYVDTERRTFYNESERVYETYYAEDYPSNCKFFIKKEYIDYVKSLGKQKIVLTVKGEYTPGIDDLSGKVQGYRKPGIAETVIDIDEIPENLISEGNIALLIYGNYASQFKISMVARKVGFDEDDPLTYVKTGSVYEYDFNTKRYERFFNNDGYGENTKFTITKEYIDYLKSLGATTLTINVTGTPKLSSSSECIRIAKADVGATDLVKVPVGESGSLTFDLNNLNNLPNDITPNDIISEDGEITLKIYNSSASSFEVWFTTDID